MAIGVNDIFDLIKVCQDFDNKFAGNDTVELFAHILGISKISYRIFFNDVSIESAVIYNADNATSGEEVDFTRITSNDRLIMVKIIRFVDAEPLSSENSYNLQVFGETVMSGICVKNLIKAYENARFYDSLTQLTNVTFFLNYLDKFLESGNTDAYSVVCVNIKNCGAINRIFGSDITDKIIRDFAQDSLDLFDTDQYEIISRLSSDSFILVVLTSNVEKVLNAMNNSEVSVELNGDIVEYNVSIRAGVVSLESNMRKSSDLIHLAENALGFSRLPENPDIYYINGDGSPNGNKSFIYLSEINAALKSNQFLLYFEPLYTLNNSLNKLELKGAEAVIRWRKDGRLVDPYALISTSSNNNIIRDIDEFLFRKTCETLSEWKREGIDYVPVMIHISSFDYFNTAFANNVIRTIERYEIDRDKIILAFDEETLYAHNEEMQVATQKFTKSGLDICIVNYGTGESSFKILSDFSYKYLSISPDLINSDSAKDMIILESIISIANKLGYDVICNNPDNDDIVKKAAGYGCSYFQGELFDKPLSERFFKRRLSNPSRSLE